MFWLVCAKRLSLRRRVQGHLPLERLDIPQLRTAIVRSLKLMLKWSGLEDVDPSPVRCKQINALPHAAGLKVERQTVTLAEMIEDGVHMVCIVGDTILQLWDLRSDAMVLSFHLGGLYFIGAQYCDEDYFVFGASVISDEEVDDEKTEWIIFCSFTTISYSCSTSSPVIKIWKYEWSATGGTDGISPIAVHILPTHPSVMFVTDTVVTMVYTTNEPRSIPSEGSAGCLMVRAIEWKGARRSLCRYTPLAFFGGANAEKAKNEGSQYSRNTSHLIMSFESLVCIEVYLYDLHLLHDFSTSQHSTIQDSSAEVIHPRKAAYMVNHKDTVFPITGEVELCWSQTCLLWDSVRIASLGYLISHETGNPFLSLSVVDLSQLLAQSGIGPSYEVQGEYRRHTVYDKKSGYKFYDVEGNRFLGSLPRYATRNVWVLGHSNAGALRTRFALANFTSERFRLNNQSDTLNATPGDGPNWEAQATAGDPSTIKKAHSKLEPGGHIVQIDMSPWFPGPEIIHDISLAERVGKVVCGMDNGKVFIFEFV